MWKKLRITILLLILISVFWDTWHDYHQDWDKPIVVLLHPINADGSALTERYMDHLSDQDVQEIQQYLQDYSLKYRNKTSIFYIKVGRHIDEHPPKISSSNLFSTMIWSLKFRYFAWKNAERSDGHPTVTLFLNYYHPNNIEKLEHSTALQKGKIGLVNLFADKRYDSSNLVVITHELLHSFGAKDKYDLITGTVKYPFGFANPEQHPLYPQTRAEIMGGYVPISDDKQRMPNRLSETILNEFTAKELQWRE